MEEFLTHIFELSTLPITSGSIFVTYPGMFAFVYGCVALVFSIMRGR